MLKLGMLKLFRTRQFLRLKTKYSILVFVALLVILPLLVWGLTSQKIELRKKATGPSTCIPTGDSVFVTPDGPCHDLQTAIDAVDRANMSILLSPGTYNIPESGTTFSINVIGKENLRIAGSQPASNAVTLQFNGNNGGVSVASSSGSIEWLAMRGVAVNGMLSIRNSTNFAVGYTHLFDEGAHTMDVSDSKEISIYNTEISSSAGGLEIGNVTNFKVSNAHIHNTDNGITVNNSQGVIQFNAIVENRENGIQIYGDSTLSVIGNTIARNNTDTPNIAAGVRIGYPKTDGSNVRFDRNIIAFNSGNGVENLTTDKGTFWFNENNIYGNRQNYVGVDQATGKDGNISADPLFGQDYCLQIGSPSLLVPPEWYMGHRGQCGINPTPTPPLTCWNRVLTSDGTYHWPDGCRGSNLPDQMCTQALVPLTEEELKLYSQWIADGRPAIPGCGPVPTCTPRPACLDAVPRCLMPETSDMCPPGCFYQEVQCVTEPCDPILVCPSPTCIPRPPDCGTQLPDGSFVICDPPPGQMFCPTATPTCMPRPRCAIEGEIGVNGQLVFCPLDPLESNVYCPLPTQTVSPTIPQASNTPSKTPTPVPTAAVTKAPAQPTTLEFLLTFAGVTDGSAEGARATFRFTLGTQFDVVTQPITLTHAGNGVYKAVLSMKKTDLPEGYGYTVTVKGEKHVARKFCQQSAQATPCTEISRMGINLPAADTIPFDFTKLPLEPGDVPPQDGVADSRDFTAIRARLSIACSSLTSEDKRIADLDYNGCVNIKDAFLMRKTLETRYDEF